MENNRGSLMKFNIYHIGLALVMLFTITVTGCSNQGKTKGSSFVINLEIKIKETMIEVQQRIGEKNEYKGFKEIEIEEQLKSVMDILNDTTWEAIQVEMSQPPHYKFSFKNKGSDEEIETFLGWVTPNKDSLEVVRDKGGYAKLTKSNSDGLFEILTGNKLSDLQ